MCIIKIPWEKYTYSYELTFVIRDINLGVTKHCRRDGQPSVKQKVAVPQAFSDGQTIPQPSLRGCLAIPQELSKSAQLPTLSFSSFIFILKYIHFVFCFS